MNRRFFLALLVLLLGGAACHADTAPPATAPASPQRLRVYHIGNSVTDAMNYASIVKLAQSRGKTYVLGRHTIPGAPLFGMLDNPEKGPFNKPFGRTTEALSTHEWDAITLQPFDRLLEGHEPQRECDLAAAIRCVDFAIQKNPQVQIYIYSRWPRRDAVDPKATPKTWKPIDYAAKWQRKFTNRWDNTNETRIYFETLTARLNDHYGSRIKPIRIIPAGDVLFELDRRVKAGAVPGMSDINELYSDHIHFNPLGSYIVAMTFYATLFHDDPRGLPSDAYGQFDPKLVAALQEVVWAVVSEHPMSGLKAP